MFLGQVLLLGVFSVLSAQTMIKLKRKDENNDGNSLSLSSEETLLSGKHDLVKDLHQE